MSRVLAAMFRLHLGSIDMGKSFYLTSLHATASSLKLLNLVHMAVDMATTMLVRLQSAFAVSASLAPWSDIAEGRCMWWLHLIRFLWLSVSLKRDNTRIKCPLLGGLSTNCAMRKGSAL